MAKLTAKEFAKRQLHLSATPVLIPGSQMYVCEVEITPKMAKDWLEKYNKKNRNPRQTTINKIVNDIQNKQWVVSHQGIGFDINHQITSGQHRLHAIVKSNKTIKSLIFLNCPAAERKVIDQNVSRNVKDVALLGHNDELSTRTVSVARAMAYGYQLSGNMTPNNLYEFIKKHQTALNFVLGKIERNIQGVTAAPVLGAICRAYYHLGRNKIDAFTKVLLGGFSVSKNDRPIVVLRNWLLENKDALGKRNFRIKAYAKTCAALEAYRKNETPDRLTEVTEEIYRLAGETIVLKGKE